MSGLLRLRGEAVRHQSAVPVIRRPVSLSLDIMNESERWEYLVALDEELLKGGVIISEWCSFIIREADNTFAQGAYLASILTAVAGIETYLRSEYTKNKRERLFKLIDSSPIDDELKKDLHKLRIYRNKWVHVDDPWGDESLLENPELYEEELEEMAFFAVKLLRRTIYENPWV